MSWPPAACTLPTAEQPLRTAKFGDLFERFLRRVERRDRVTLSLSFAPGARAEADRLVAQEQRCCSFFRFEASAEQDSYVLEVGVPPEHVGVLDGLSAQAEAVLAGPQAPREIR